VLSVLFYHQVFYVPEPVLASLELISELESFDRILVHQIHKLWITQIELLLTTRLSGELLRIFIFNPISCPDRLIISHVSLISCSCNLVVQNLIIIVWNVFLMLSVPAYQLSIDIWIHVHGSEVLLWLLEAAELIALVLSTA